MLSPYGMQRLPRALALMPSKRLYASPVCRPNRYKDRLALQGGLVAVGEFRRHPNRHSGGIYGQEVRSKSV